MILLSRRLEELEATRLTLPQPEMHRSLALDLEKTDTLAKSLGQLVQETGPIAIWVNNSGGPKAGALAEALLHDMEQAFKGHALASQIILNAVLPGMKSEGYGRIVSVLSTSVRMPLPNLGVSNMIRAAMASWGKTLATELGPFGITVNSVLPGFTSTPRLEALIQGAAQKSGRSAEVVRKEWQDSVPMRRFAEASETAQAIAFLASPLAGYISGVQLPVDGARTGAL